MDSNREVAALEPETDEQRDWREYDEAHAEEQARHGGEPWSEEEKEAIADGTADLPRGAITTRDLMVCGKATCEKHQSIATRANEILFPQTFAEHARYLAMLQR